MPDLTNRDHYLDPKTCVLYELVSVSEDGHAYLVNRQGYGLLANLEELIGPWVRKRRMPLKGR
jgi:hypothetical protein